MDFKLIFQTGYALKIIISLLFLISLPFNSLAKKAVSTPSKAKTSKAQAVKKKAAHNIEGWKFVRLADGVSTYKLKTDKNTIGVFHSQTAKKPVNWKKINPDTFFIKIIEEKQSLMSMIDVFDWTTNERSWSKKGRGFELTMSGSYTDKKDKKIYFREYHFYLPKKTHQVLITSPNKELLSTRQTSDSLKNTYPATVFFEQAKQILNQK